MDEGLVSQLVDLLRLALTSRDRRSEAIDRFQRIVWDIDEQADDPLLDVFSDLALDFEYYRPGINPHHEGIQVFGDERFGDEVREALRKAERLRRS